jgi:uncharacterized membrane protein (DUF2068 family)
MKRSPLITVVNVLQSCLALALAGLTTYLISLTRSQQTLADPDSAETIHRLLVGAAVLGIPALITMIAAWGLWKRRFWGWVLSLATDVGTLAVFLYNMVGHNDREAGEMAMAGGLVVLIVLLVLPTVRAFFWTAATTTVQK